ncbi:MAG: hypothetical protein K0R54_2506 [Clostridiaceae bacterium]|jgi:RNA polymerase sigma-70 factor (ECF subfamily)|nr:hypothetical protein [Clostridiaceae bacterium]
MDEDLKLVEEILKGNIDSFNILVNKYELIVLKFIYNMIKHKEAAEDITQEVFITIYNKMYLYNNKYKFSNWMFQIAKNKCIDYIRKYRRTYESNIEDHINLSSKETSPEEAIEYRETKNTVEKFINSLETTDKVIFIMKYTKENITFADIAEALNISESSVKRRYYKARDKFREAEFFKEKRCKL